MNQNDLSWVISVVSNAPAQDIGQIKQKIKWLEYFLHELEKNIPKES